MNLVLRYQETLQEKKMRERRESGHSFRVIGADVTVTGEKKI